MTAVERGAGEALGAVVRPLRRAAISSGGETVEPPFQAQFADLFRLHFPRLYRYLDRLSGEPDLAADLAQDAFVRLYRRGSTPDSPEAWLVTVANNLFRNARSKRSRQLRLLMSRPLEELVGEPPLSPTEAAEVRESRRRVRAAIDRLPEREQRMLLLRAEGYSYRDIALALELNEASVGTLLARAKRAFRDAYEDAFDAP